MGIIGVALGLIVQLLPLIWVAKALLDAALKADGEPEVRLLDKTNWVIVRKKMTWGEAATYCNYKYLRLAVLDEVMSAEQLIGKLSNISEPYTDEYDKKNATVEFGMDRRYWIGLSDQMQEGKWVWIQDGSQLQYMRFWYPGQPDHNKTTQNKKLEHCVTLWNPGYHYQDKHSFNDEECLNEHYAICDVKELPIPKG
ncbi:unnamed protein product [Orchesella dallaii]|uniref:C-type lectin domain-containing protein n=1 Tax=Orchesella dallaii TaxID=48710 RepID=A0ABP1QR45_9HEXA